MSAAHTLESPASKWDLVQSDPARALTEPETFRDVLAAMKAEIDAFKPDVSTAKGRHAIAALAFKVTRTKTAIDAAGKKLNEDHRAAINAVDDKRREAKAALEALSEQVRRPLTEWEEAEKARVARVDAFFADVKERIGQTGGTAALLAMRLEDAQAIEIDPAVFLDQADDAGKRRDELVVVLTSAHQAAVQAETDRAELERLRREDDERKARERADAEAKANAEREAQAKRDAEDKARRDAEAQKAREEEAARQAEQRARDAAEAEARKAQEEQRRQHEAELAAERRRADEAEAARKAEADRAAAAEKARQDEAARLAREQAAREADQAHRSEIMKAAKEAIIEHGGITEKAAKAIVLAIIAGSVPHTSIRF